MSSSMSSGTGAFAGGVTFEALSQAAVAHSRTSGGVPLIGSGSGAKNNIEAPSPVSVAKSPAAAVAAAQCQANAAGAASTILTPRNEVLRLGATVGNLCSALLTYAPLDPPHRDPLPKGVDESKTFPPTLADTADDNPAITFWSDTEASAGRNQIAQAMGSVFLALFVAAHACGVDLRVCILKKLELNGKKYPVELCKGKSGKYTEYSSHTGITADHRSQSTVGEEPEPSSSPSTSQETTSSDEATMATRTPTVSSITARIRNFATERSWSRYHTPRNIVLAMMGEVGELAELFQWKGDGEVGAPVGLAGWCEEDVDHVSQELADVSIYLMRLADVCGVDLGGESMDLASSSKSD